MNIDDNQQMLLNEYNSIQRQIEQRARDITQLEALIGNGTFRAKYPRWYNVEFDFEAGVLEPQERSFFVSGGTYFQPYTIGSALRIIGNTNIVIGPEATDVGAGQVVNVTVPWGPSLSAAKAQRRQSYFDYFWEVRDNGSDRPWQNQPQPSVFMGGGGLANMDLPVPGTIKGGAEVFVNIYPFFSRSGTELGLFYETARYRLTVSFFGLEAR